MSTVFTELSAAIAAQAAKAAALLVRIGGDQDRGLSGILWRADAVVTSEQALGRQADYPILLANGSQVTGRLAGRDPGTNVAVLRIDPQPGFAEPRPAAAPQLGVLALALGAGPIVKLTMLHAVGPEWTSQAGGRIDQLLRLDLRASRRLEGGPVVDAAGDLLGMTTAGPRGRTLVIPHATIARRLDPLLTGGTVRPGWLGVGLQPVSLPDSLHAAAGQGAGLMVVSLAPGGPAEAGGCLPGDILLALDDQTMLHPRAIRAVLGADRVGKPVAVKLLRAGVVQVIDLTIAARPVARPAE